MFRTAFSCTKLSAGGVFPPVTARKQSRAREQAFGWAVFLIAGKVY